MVFKDQCMFCLFSAEAALMLHPYSTFIIHTSMLALVIHMHCNLASLMKWIWPNITFPLWVVFETHVQHCPLLFTTIQTAHSPWKSYVTKSLRSVVTLVADKKKRLGHGANHIQEHESSLFPIGYSPLKKANTVPTRQHNTSVWIWCKQGMTNKHFFISEGHKCIK